MSQVNVGTTQLNTLTSGGSTISIPKNITVSGNINFTGDLLQNGVLFETLPSQSPKTAGGILMSDGMNAFWGTTLAAEGDVGGNNNFGYYNSYPTTTTGAGGQNPTVASVSFRLGFIRVKS